MMPYDKIVEQIIAQKHKEKHEVEALIAAKLSEFSGLISKDGAAHIIANDLGVVLDGNGVFTIKELSANQKNITVIATVTKKYDPVVFQRENGQGRVCSLTLSDSTGSTRLTFWHDDVMFAEQFKEGGTYRLSNVTARLNKDKVELTYSSRSKAEAVETPVKTVAIDQLAAGESNVEFSGTIVQVFKPNYYVVDKTTRKKSTDPFDATKHDWGYVMNVIVDDGTQTIRTVLFGQVACALCDCPAAVMVAFKDDEIGFERMRTRLLGCELHVAGRIVHNQMYDRLECVVSRVACSEFKQ